MKRLTSGLVNLFLVFISIGLTYGLCEYAYRKAIFGNNPTFQKYRVPSDYAREWDENFWKLNRIWDITSDMKVHPTFGWAYKFFPNTYLHPDVEFDKSKRPVLIYGDSFVSCIDSTFNYCWEDYLNNSPIFNKDYFLYNYGIGAHGVDQIFTVMKYTYSHFQKPLVIFTFMTDDLDRSILTFREGQKPVYHLNENDSLIYDNSQLKKTQQEYLENHPPSIKSYLFRRFLFSDLNFLPMKVNRYLSGETHARGKILKLNSALIKEAIKMLRNSKTDFFIIVFNQHQDFFLKPEENWRLNCVKSLLETEKAPYLIAMDFAKEEVNRDSLAIDKYLIKDNGHPTPYFNEIISKEITRKIQEKEYESFNDSAFDNISDYYANKIDSVKESILSDPEEKEIVANLSKERKIGFDEMLLKHAIYLYWIKYDHETRWDLN